MVNRRSFTLVELIMVLAIISTLAAVGAPMMLQANRNFILSRSRIELQQEARFIMYMLTRSLRQARSATISIDRANNAQPFCSRITFTKEQGDVLSFQQEGKTLYQRFPDTNLKRKLSGNLDYLAFTFPRSDDMTIISVSLTLRKDIYEGQTKALHMASEKVRVMN